MIEQLRTYIIEQSKTNVSFPDVGSGSGLSISKFCQRIAGPHTKVLFLVVHKQKPICIVKIVRSADYNERLKKEKEAQVRAATHLTGISVPRVYSDGYIGEHYVYAEEVVSGRVLSRKNAKDRVREVIRGIASIPKSRHCISTSHMIEVVRKKIPLIESAVINKSLSFLASTSQDLISAFSHSDLGRVNMLLRDDGVLFLIDWERANRKPLWLFDAVYFLLTLYRVKTIDEWREYPAQILIREAGTSREYADLLYHTILLCVELQKHYPEENRDIMYEVFKDIVV